jgi:tetratricopeptide (TPR) repeat protein
MASILARIILSFFLLLLFIPHPTSAETKTFIKEYTYQASEDDSRNSSRTLALREVKRLLLEELGTYLESVTEVQNFRLTKDRITALTAGIVQTEIMADKWDGDSLKYWLKAKIVADSDEVIKAIDALRNDRAKTKELEGIKRRSDELLRENQRLRKELSAATVGQKQEELAAYNKTIKDLSAIDWEERSYALAVTGKNEGIKTFNKFIELNPQNAKVIYYRGLAYANIGDSQQAIKDYSKAIEIDPKYVEAYGDRGKTYAGIGNYQQAIKDYNNVIGLGSYREIAYCFRGIAYSKLNNFKQAIKDYDSSIKIDPKYADAYGNRGIAHASLVNYRQAIRDFNKVIEINALNGLHSGDFDSGRSEDAYYYRGIVYDKLGNYRQAIEDYDRSLSSILSTYAIPDAYYRKGIAFKKLGDNSRAIENYKRAASLGHKEAQVYLKKRGIKW